MDNDVIELKLKPMPVRAKMLYYDAHGGFDEACYDLDTF